VTARELLVRGVGASPGLTSGAIVFRTEDAVRLAAEGQAVVLLRIDTNAEDVPGIRAAAGVITTRGGITGDAAIVARTLGKPCIAGCASMRVDYGTRTCTVLRDMSAALAERADVVLREGDVITFDGGTGEIWRG
jgi:pyruvate,orthophosphate dikinase